MLGAVVEQKIKKIARETQTTLFEDVQADDLRRCTDTSLQIKAKIFFTYEIVACEFGRDCTVSVISVAKSGAG